MNNVNVYKRTKDNTLRTDFYVSDINDLKDKLESLRWKYRKQYMTMPEFINQQITDRKNTIQIELWRKNKHNDIWVGIGDYFFLENKELEKDVYELFK